MKTGTTSLKPRGLLTALLCIAVLLILASCSPEPKHVHDWGEGTVTTEPTCTAEGVRTFTCECGETKTEPVPALGHDYSEEWTIDSDPTCSQAGSKSHHCSRCDSKADVTAIPTLEHTWNAGAVTTNPTCEAEGVKTFTCTVCNAVTTEPVPALGHDYSEDWTTDTPATCTEAGSKSHHCSRCDSKADVTVIPALGHSWNAGVVTTEPTCTAAGVRTFTCTVCGDTTTEPIEALGHDYSEDWTIDTPATCTENGSKSHHCSRCDSKADVTVIPALGHDYSENWTIDTPATCTEAGSKSHHCSRCDSKADVTVIPALGHSWNAGVVTTEPTCTAAGVRTFTCTVCGDTTTEPIAALGHSWNAGTVTTEPTCIAAGVRTFTCTVCGDTTTEPIAALGHDYSEEWTIDTPATCTEAGSKSHHCSRCDSKADVTEIPATGHSWNAGVVTTEPQEFVEGVRTYTCTVCGATREEAIPRTHVHSFEGDWKYRQEQGNPVRYKTCSCGEGGPGEAAEYDEIFGEFWGGLYVTNRNLMTGDWELPSTFEGNPVTSYSLFQQPGLTGIILPDTVTDFDLTELPDLHYLFISEAVTDIYPSFLSECADDLVVEISDDNPNYKIVDGMLLSKDGTVFYSPMNRTGEITIPEGVTTIDGMAFYCTAVTSVSLPSTLTTIEDYTFSELLITQISLPSKLTTIGENAFHNTLLTEITIPSSVTSIGDGAFNECQNLQSVSIQASIDEIPSNMFAGCPRLETVSIPSSVTSIGDNAFYNCASLESINIPSDVTSIGDSAFYECASLESITIPASVTTIKNGAFYGCSGLSVTVDGANQDFLSDNGALYSKDRTQLILNTTASGEVVIDDSVISIEEGAFRGNSAIRSVYVPDSVRHIGYGAFSDCENLEEITIAASGDYLTAGAEIFKGTPAHITIASDWIMIPNHMFDGCDMITGITLPDTIGYIGSYSFRDCTANITVTIPASYTGLPDSWAFNGCTCDFAFAPGTTVIPTKALNGSSSEHITIPGSVTEIRADAFLGCGSLQDITFGGTLEQWGNVVKEDGWIGHAITVICSDGSVAASPD